MALLSRFIDAQIPDKLRNGGVDTHRRARLIVAFTLAPDCLGPVFATIYLLLQLPSLAVGILVGVVLGLINLRLVRVFCSIRLSGNLVAAILYCLISYLCVRTGGINSPAVSWYIAIPVIGTMMLGYRNGVVWLILTLAVMPILFIEQRSHWPIAISLDATKCPFGVWLRH